MRRLRLVASVSITVLLLLSPRAARSTPPAPTGFDVFPTTCGAVWLSWNPVPGVIAGYHLYRNGSPITSLGPLADRYYDYETPGPGLYTYAIESYDLSGASPQVTADATRPAPDLSVDPWDWFHDVFPAPDFDNPPGTPGFALTTAKVRTGHNNAPLTGDLTRGVTPGSNVFVNAPGAIGVSIHYRIKPGPGNYVVPGNPGFGLALVPGSPVAACTGDGSYWDPDIGPPCPGVWDPDNWITKPCDPAGAGRFQTTNGGVPIFPDDLFTPGTVIQYYFLAEYAGSFGLALPDPYCVMQVANQNSLDGHRWEQFTVLPDLWKDPAYGGPGLACALVVDLEDGRGNERIWAGLSDSLGGTAPAARGRYNGWSAPGTDPGNWANPVDLDFSAYFVSGPNMAAGTTWDLYSVRGWQSNAMGNAGALGGWLGMVPPGSYPPGPTPAMLDAYYRIIVLLTGDRSADILGPINDRSQDDTELIRQFLLGATLDRHRGILVVGNGFVTSENASGNVTILNLLYVSLRDESFPSFSGSTASCTGLNPTSPITTGAERFAVCNPLGAANDVLDTKYGVAGAYYDPVGADPLNAPYIASVFTDTEPTKYPDNHWQSLVEGWNIRDLRARLCGSGYGRLEYYSDVFNNVFGKICTIFGTPPPQDTDVPGGDPSHGGTGLLGLGNNPMRESDAEIRFTLAGRDRVGAAVHDLAGRTVRVIPAREFEAGDQALTWDGKDDAGRLLPRGMYFVRVRFERTGGTGVLQVVLLR